MGEGEPRQIVCGAWNFGAGATVAVALPGAVLPGGQKLERAKLRGTVSDGMILSESELELGTDHSGILVLGEGEPGAPLVDVLPVTDEVLEVEPTGNRPDLLSVYGLAREVAAIYGSELAPPPGTDPERHGERAGRRHDRGLRRLPALRRTALQRGAGRALAALAARPPDRSPACGRSRTSST